jgi:serine/threonine-protein kinase
MKIEGYGNELQPFERLDDAFKKAFGFEAEIDFRQLTESQCPAATFLGSLRQRGAEPPRIELAQLRVPSGDELAGQVAQESAHLSLLLVSEDGLVRNVTGGLTPGGPSRPFRFPVWRTLAPPGQPQLLIAVDSSRPLTSLAFRGSKAGALVFPATLAEASRSGEALTATLAYFKVD